MWLLLLLLPLNSSFPWVGKSLSCLEAASGAVAAWHEKGTVLLHGAGKEQQGKN